MAPHGLVDASAAIPLRIEDVPSQNPVFLWIIKTPGREHASTERERC